MYKILLTENDQSVLDFLRDTIEKSFPQKCKIKTAGNGREAIQEAENFLPDLIFADIQTPGGCETNTILKIKERYPKIFFVLLFTDDKLYHAEKMLKLNNTEYLTKPVSAVGIKEVLYRAFTKIDKEKQNHNKDMGFKENSKWENDFIYSIVFHESFGKEMLKYKTFLNLQAGGGYVMNIKFAVPVSRNRVKGRIDAHENTEIDLYVKKTMRSICNCIVGPLMFSNIVVFIPENHSDEYRLNIAEQIYSRLSEKLGIEIRIGIGSYQSAFDKFSQSYDEALKALRSVPLKVAYYEELPSEQIAKDDYPASLEKSFLEKCRNGEDMAKDVFSDIFDWLVQTRGINSSDIKMKLLELVFMAERLAYTNEDMEGGFSEHSKDFETLEEIEGYREIKRWCMNRIAVAVNAMCVNKKNKAWNVTMTAKRFIDSNFHKDITLEDVAREVNLSTYYFSKLFKAEVGENFIDYLTHVRLDRAKELLENKSLSIKEICFTIGYADPNYFSRNFKKIVGVTPTEYRERL